MAAIVRQLDRSVGDHAEWLSVEQAAQLTGESVRHWRRRAEFQARGATSSHHTPPARLMDSPTGRGRKTWYIHRSFDARLTRHPTTTLRDDRERESLIARYPERHVTLAYSRAYWLRQWWTACQRRCEPFITKRQIAMRIVAEAKRVEGRDFRISVRTLEQWSKDYYARRPDGVIPGVEALIDKRCLALSATVGDRTTLTRSSDAIEYFYSLYHAATKHSIRTCHEATTIKAESEGWSWPAGLSATRRWLRENDDRAMTCLYRDGRTAYSKRYMQHLQIDYTTIEPGDRYVLDHTPADFWCRYRDRLIRPWFTAVLDARSRCLVGWRLGPSPNQDAILEAVRMAFTRWGIPLHVHIDRGKDFTSELLTGFTKREKLRLRKEHGPDWRNQFRHQLDVLWMGVFGELGIEIAEATPRHPWAKGQVERVFRRFEDECGKQFFTYWGNNPLTRPEAAEALRHADDVPTLDDAIAKMTDWVELYHRSPHRGQGMEGRSPLDVWHTATRVRKAVEGELLQLMQSRGVYRVGANGVSFRACGATVTYGGDHPEIFRRRGRDVFITVDPQDWSCCYAYDINDRGDKTYIGKLSANKPIPVNTTTDELREAIRASRHREKMFTAAKAEEPHRMRNAAAEVAAMRSKQLERLRATGTDDHHPDVVLVQTGFSTSNRTSTETHSARPQTEPCIDSPVMDLDELLGPEEMSEDPDVNPTYEELFGPEILDEGDVEPPELDQLL